MRVATWKQTPLKQQPQEHQPWQHQPREQQPQEQQKRVQQLRELQPWKHQPLEQHCSSCGSNSHWSISHRSSSPQPREQQPLEQTHRDHEPQQEQLGESNSHRNTAATGAAAAAAAAFRQLPGGTPKLCNTQSFLLHIFIFDNQYRTMFFYTSSYQSIYYQTQKFLKLSVNRYRSMVNKLQTIEARRPNDDQFLACRALLYSYSFTISIVTQPNHCLFT